MIFVTVGTHEQPFNRLIEHIDNLKKKNIIKEDVIVQTGYSTYEPEHCISTKMISFEKMISYISQARIVITHGGPASFIQPLQMGKIPIVVPRQFKFKEHVNNHQVEFSQFVANRWKTIITVADIQELENIILNYEKIVCDMKSKIQSNNELFNQKFENIVNELMI